MTTPRPVTGPTITMRQIAALFRESTDPGIVRDAALALTSGAMLLIAPPTVRENQRALERLAMAWNQGHGCAHLADSPEPAPNLEPEPCAVCERFYVDE